MKQTQILPALLLILFPNFIFCQYSYEEIFGEYIFQVNRQPIMEKLILKENFKFAYERKTSKIFTEKGIDEQKKQYKGLIGKYALDEDKIVLSPTKLWLKKRNRDLETIIEKEEIEEQAAMPKTLFIYKEGDQIYLKINNDLWVKTK